MALETVFAQDMSGGDRKKAQDILILMTDGKPTTDEDTLDEIVHEIKRKGIRIIGVGVTDQVNKTLMKTLVTQPWQSYYLTVEKYSEISEILDSLILGACRPVPPTPCKWNMFCMVGLI